ncbi:MAG: actin-binding ADF family protein [Candidatus Kariarchaeaceae archaeon]|jgi:cofilin
MSMSGVTIQHEVVKAYEDMRFKQQPGGMIFTINEGLIEVEKEVGNDFAEMVEGLPLDEPRFVLFDVPMKNRTGLDVVKTVFIFWLPMESPVRMRMLYASSKSVILKELRGISTQIQEDEKDGLALERVIQKVNKTQGINIG